MGGMPIGPTLKVKCGLIPTEVEMTEFRIVRSLAGAEFVVEIGAHDTAKGVLRFHR